MKSQYSPFKPETSARPWKEQAEDLATALVETTQRLEDTAADLEVAESRLAEIAAIAAPDESERMERIEQQQQEILGLLRELVRRQQGDPPETLGGL